MNEVKYTIPFALTSEETEACRKLVMEMRAEKQRQEKIEKWQERVERATQLMIKDIGADDAKRIIRNINMLIEN